MRRMHYWMWRWIPAVLVCTPLWLGGVELPGSVGDASAADALSIDGLPKDPKAYRAQVDQLLKKVDGLIEKLKGNPTATAIVLDLLQTRDDILREIPKAEVKPDGAKWTLQEGRESVDAKLKLLKALYDKAAAL